MTNEIEHMCPFYNELVDDAKCYDMFMVSDRFFKNEELVPEKDRDALHEMCLKCGKQGCD